MARDRPVRLTPPRPAARRPARSQLAVTFASAANSIVLDVAPGSWWPTSAGRGRRRGPCGPASGWSPRCRPRPPSPPRRRVGQRGPRPERGVEGGQRRQPRVDHGLVARPRPCRAGRSRPGRPAAPRRTSCRRPRRHRRAPWPSARNAVPYSGPDAPPTFEISVRPTSLSTSRRRVGPRPASSVDRGRSRGDRLAPWSPSPIAGSSLVSSVPRRRDRGVRTRGPRPRRARVSTGTQTPSADPGC